jgi:hypothetical protein
MRKARKGCETNLFPSILGKPKKTLALKLSYKRCGSLEILVMFVTAFVTVPYNFQFEVLLFLLSFKYLNTFPSILCVINPHRVNRGGL